MSDSHFTALQQKHDGLEKKIHEEEIRPAPDSTILAQLKKQKLRIKEEIALT